MSNIQNIDISLQEIVKNISKDSYLIPKFQRDFVWNTKDIIDLGDSIIRGYPISSLLIMPANGTLKVGAHSLLKDETDNDQSVISELESDLKHYILDGQQRMTSIAKLFLASDNKNEYYFDLLAIINEKYPHDDVKSDCGLGLQENKNLSIISESLCRSFPMGKDQSEKPTRQNNRFISGKSIIENKFGSVVNKFLRQLQDATEENLDKYTDYLNAVLGAVGSYSVPATVINSDSDLGVVIRVFEKVNSTGKKLTLFDLINAKSFQVQKNSYKDGLSTYLTKKILNATSKNTRLTSGVNSFFKLDEDKGTFEKLDRIIRIFEIAHLLKKGDIPSLFQSEMLQKDPIFWFESWDSNGDKLLEVISWMNEESLIDIGSITFLEYAAAIILANPKSLELLKFKTEIKKYSIYLILTDSNFNKSNLDMVKKIYEISKIMTDNHESQRKYDSPSSNPNLTPNKILETTASKIGFKAIMSVLYNDKPEGKFTTDLVGNPIKKLDKSKMDNHHIYPKSRVANFSNQSKFNSVANIVLLDNNANREEIKDKSMSDYFKQISEAPKGRFNCEQNLIDLDDAINVTSEEQAELFLQSRAEKIAKIVNDYFL